MAKKPFNEIEKEIYQRANLFNKIGESRHELKANGITTRDKVTAPKSMESMIVNVTRFMKYQYETRGITSITQITNKDMEKWLERGKVGKFDTDGNQINKPWAPSTVKKYATDLCKMFQVDGGIRGLKIDYEKVSYLDTTRSRQEVNHDKYIKKDNPDIKNIIKFCEGVGLRKGEALQIRGDQIQIRPYLNSVNGKFEERVCVVFQGKDKYMTKGGRERIAPVLKGYEQHILAMKSKLQNDKDKVFGDLERKVAKVDIHGDGRRVYAQKYYEELKNRFGECQDKNERVAKSARISFTKFKGNEMNFSKKQTVSRIYETRPGGREEKEKYDRILARECSQALGHNREDVVIRSYFH